MRAASVLGAALVASAVAAVPPSPAAAADPAPPTPGSAPPPTFTVYDKDASDWWSDQVRANLPDVKFPLGEDDVLVVHAPSGLPVDVFSPLVPSSSVIHVLVLEPWDVPLSIDITGTRGDLTKQAWLQRQAAPADDGVGAGRSRKETRFTLRYVAAVSGCSEGCRYGLKIKEVNGAREGLSELSFNAAPQARDHFALSTGFGYDFARSTDYFLGADGRPRTTGYTGPGLLLTGRWDWVCASAGDTCFGPFLGVRASLPVNNFIAGAALFFAKRLSLQAGISIHKAESFVEETRSIRRTWNGDRMGLVLGLSVDAVQFGRW